MIARGIGASVGCQKFASSGAWFAKNRNQSGSVTATQNFTVTYKVPKNSTLWNCRPSYVGLFVQTLYARAMPLSGPNAKPLSSQPPQTALARPSPSPALSQAPARVDAPPPAGDGGTRAAPGEPTAGLFLMA